MNAGLSWFWNCPLSVGIFSVNAYVLETLNNRENNVTKNWNKQWKAMKKLSGLVCLKDAWLLEVCALPSIQSPKVARSKPLGEQIWSTAKPYCLKLPFYLFLRGAVFVWQLWRLNRPGRSCFSFHFRVYRQQSSSYMGLCWSLVPPLPFAEVGEQAIQWGPDAAGILLKFQGYQWKRHHLWVAI